MGRRRPARMQVPRSRSYRAADRRADMRTVCLIGWAEAGPRFFGDNRGGLPVRVVVTKNVRTAAKDDDLSQPYSRFVVLEHVHVGSEEHGKRLKAALDTMLLGEQTAQRNDQPRHKFRDVSGCFSDDWTRQMWWDIMLDAALQHLAQGAREFRVYDDDERLAKIGSDAKRAARGR